MRTIIRLQNHGCRGHPYWWITIQGSYTNPKGRFIEHVGYFMPRKGRTVQRAVVLNKPRILYWLAMGAQTSPAVHRILSYIDYMPKPLPGIGARYMYEKEPINHPKPENPEVRRLGVFAPQYERIRNREEMNLFERELRSQAEMKKQIRFNEEVEDIELVQSDVEDVYERTKAFNFLRTRFLELEKDTKNLNVRKRELLFRKMNKLSSAGLLSNQEIEAKEVSEERGLYGTTAKERIEQEAKMAKLMEIKRNQYEKALHDIELLKPISQDDFVQYLMEHTDMSAHKAKREVEEFYKAANDMDVVITKQDALMNTHKIKQFKEVRELKKMDKKDYVLPVRHNITPFPDIGAFDPQNYYDTQAGPAEEHDPNKAYNSLSGIPTEPRFRGLNYRRKQNKGRKTPVRVNFSTLNTASKRTPFATQPSLNFAYTGLMRKISSSWYN